MKTILLLLIAIIALSSCSMKQDKTEQDDIENISQTKQDICTILLREYSNAIDTIAYEYFSDMQYAEMIKLLEQHNKALIKLFEETEKHLKQADVKQAEIYMSAYFNDYDSCEDYLSAIKIYHFLRVNQKRLWRENNEKFSSLVKSVAKSEKHLDFILDRLPALKKSISSILQQNEFLKLETDSTNADGTWKSKPRSRSIYDQTYRDSIDRIYQQRLNSLGR